MNILRLLLLLLLLLRGSVQRGRGGGGSRAQRLRGSNAAAAAAAAAASMHADARSVGAICGSAIRMVLFRRNLLGSTTSRGVLRILRSKEPRRLLLALVAVLAAPPHGVVDARFVGPHLRRPIVLQWWCLQRC